MPTRLTLRTGQHETGVLIGRGRFDQLDEQLEPLFTTPPTGIALVTDGNVGPLYADRAASRLAALAPVLATCTVDAGEHSKCAEELTRLCGRLARSGLDRDGLLVALGGGVVNDLAGFAAAIYKRGIDFVTLPTSLLAQVDASIGGKTGIDLAEGKNLVGAFHHPRAVLVDPDLLASLPEVEWKNGLGEVIKYGLLGDRDLFLQLEQCEPARLRADTTAVESLVTRCAAQKVDLCSRDANDRGVRQGLNLGHTFGHALEAAAGFSGLRHGEAVALGMIAEADLSHRLGRAGAGLSRRVSELCARLGLPTRAPALAPALAMDDVRAFLMTDKKRIGRALRFALPVELGRVEILDVTETEAVDSALAILFESS